MHFTDAWAIRERDHDIQNPLSPAKLALLADYCRVRDGLRVLDVGCGKGVLLRTWAQQWAIDGTGLEINPHFVAAAREQAAAGGVAERVRFAEGAALDFRPEPASYDIVMCIGASFALGGFDEALRWMRRALKPNGVLAIGEVFANETPFPPEARHEQFRDLPATVAVLHENDLELTGLIAASPDDWDHYVSRHWRAVGEWAHHNPGHPHRVDLLEQNSTAQQRYFGWERRYLGWAIFVAKPVHG